MVFGIKQMKNQIEIGDSEVSKNPEIKRVLDSINNAKNIKELKDGLENLYMCMQALPAKDNGKLIEYLEKIYLGSTDIINREEKTIRPNVLLDKVKKYIASVDNAFWQPSSETKPASTSRKSDKDYARLMEKFVSDLASRLQYFPGPQAAYGLSAENELPVWAEQMKNDKATLDGHYIDKGTFQKQFETALQMISKGMGKNEKELMLALGSDPENFRKAMCQITKTQRTIDAISLAIEYRQMGAMIGGGETKAGQEESFKAKLSKIAPDASDEEIGKYVEIMKGNDPSRAIKELLGGIMFSVDIPEKLGTVKSLDITNGSTTITLSLDEQKNLLSEGGSIKKGDFTIENKNGKLNIYTMSDLEKRMSALVIDANYGEGASGLKFLIDDMSGVGVYDDTKRTPDITIKNLESFYSGLVGVSGLGSEKYKEAWSALNGIEIGGKLFTTSFPQALLFRADIPAELGTVDSLDITNGSTTITLSLDEQKNLMADGSSITQGIYTIENNNGKLNVYLSGKMQSGSVSITNSTGSISILLTTDELNALSTDGNSVTKGIYLVQSRNGMLEVSLAGKTSLASLLLNERQYIPDSSAGVERGRHDIAVLAAFMYQYDKSEYFKSPLFRDPAHSTRFLGAITGFGGVTLPMPVTLTMLENTETLDFLYRNFSFDQDSFLSIINTTVSNLANKIYAQPFGSSFNSVGPGKKAPETRYAAGAMLVKEIPNLQGNWLLDDLLAKLTDLSYREDESYIKIKAIWQIIQLYPQYFDSDDIGQFMNALNIRPSDWNNPWQAYRNIEEYVRNNPKVNLAQIEKINAIIQRLPRVYIDGIDRIGDMIIKKSLYSKVTEVSGTGNLAWSHDVDRPNIYKYDRTNLYANANAATTTGNVSSTVSHMGDTETSYDSKSINSTWNAQYDANKVYLGQTIIKDSMLDLITTKIESGDLTAEQVSMDNETRSMTDAVIGNANVLLYFDKSAYNSINTQFGKKEFSKTPWDPTNDPNGTQFQAGFLSSMQAVDPAITSFTPEIAGRLTQLKDNGQSYEFTLNNKNYIAYVKEGMIGLYTRYDEATESGMERNRMHYEALVRLNGQYFKVGGLDKLMREYDEAGKIIGEYVSAQQTYFEWEKGQKVWSANPDKKGIGMFTAGEYQKRDVWINTSDAASDLQTKGITLTQEQKDAIAALAANETITISGNGRQYEVRMKDDGTQDVLLAPPDRFGLVLGVEVAEGRLAALGVKTPENGKLGALSYANKKARENAGKEGSGNWGGTVISAGAFTYGTDQTNLVGKQSWSTDALNQTGNQIGAAVQEDVKKEAFGFASYTLINRLYGIVIGNPNLVAGKIVGQNIGMSSFGASGLMRWGGDAARTYMFDGQYQYADIVNVQAFGQNREGMLERTGARATINIGGQKEIYLYGVDNTVLNMPLYRKNYQTFEQIYKQAADLRDEIDEYTTGGPNSKWSTAKGRNALLRGFAQRQFNILDEIHKAQTGNALGVVENQFTAGLIDKKNGDALKISLARVKIEKTDDASTLFENSDAMYLSSLTSWNVSKNKAGNKVISAVIGFPVGYFGKTKEEKEFGKQYSVKNYIGAKYTVNDIAFGITGNNLGSTKQNPTAMKMSIGYVNPKFNAGGNLKLFEGGGHTEDFTIGNQRVLLGTITHGNVAGTNSISLAVTRAFGFAAAATTINYGTLYGRMSTTGDLKTAEFGAAYEMQYGDRLSLRATTSLVNMKMRDDVKSSTDDVKSSNLNVNVGIVYRVRYR